MTIRKTLIIMGAVLFLTTAAFLSVNWVSTATGPVTVPPSDPNAACINCHSLDLSYTFPDSEVLSVQVDYSKFKSSIHGEIVRCSICHPDIANNNTLFPHPVVTASNPKEYAASQSQICKECHDEEYQDLQTSIHGLKADVQIAICTDCHSAHYANDINTPTYRQDSVDYCSDCHGDEELMERYSLSTNVVSSYLQDFHGKTTYLIGEEAKNLSIETAVCSDCHGSHSMVAITPENEEIIQQNFANACRECHPGASDSFTSAWLSHNQPSTSYAQAVFGVSWFYRIMIAFVLVGLFIHIGFDVYTRRKNKGEF